MSQLLHIFNNYKHVKKLFFWTVFLGFVSEVMVLSAPKLMQLAIDQLTLKIIDQTFFRICVGLIVTCIVDCISNRASRTIKSYIRTKLYAIKIQQYYNKLFTLDYQLLHKIGTGKTMTRVQNGIEAELSIFDAILEASFGILMRGGLLAIILFMTMPWLNALLIINFGVVLIINNFTLAKVKPLTKRLNKISEEIGRLTSKLIMENTLIRLSNKQAYELQKVATLQKDQPMIQAKADFINDVNYEIFYIILETIKTLAIILIGYQVVAWTESIGYLVMIATYLGYLRRPINVLLHQSGQIRKNVVRYTKLQKFLSIAPTIIDGKQKFIYKEEGKISLTDITFGYHTQDPLFKNFSLDLLAGKTTALVGHSGSGKSTLVKLLLRFYDPSQGKILVDGKNLKTLQRKTYYQHIGYLSQEPAIFDGTVRENLAYALDDTSTISDEQYREACQKAHIDPLIRKMAKQLDTQLGEKGVKLSGGERQRLAIARIFLKNPDILILDEPTSALDSVAEAAITDMLKTMTKNKTVIVIAHRLQTVMHADQIIVLEHGKIVQQGKHTQLLKQDGVYKTLVDLQKGVINE